MSDLITESLTKLAELVRTRQVSPVEIADAYLTQIDRFNPQLNAVVTLAPDVLDQARAAEAAIMSGESFGPLHGLPLTIKDTIETAGLRSTSGSPARAHFVPRIDAPAIARLKSAGAIILGKTNPAEMAMDYTADNPVFGRTNNPCNLSRTPGGSSGGEAAAISACLSPGGLGSDLAGSIRIPAHFCGIAGLKPTTGRIPGAGQFPPSIGPYSLGAVIGPMARSVADLRLLYDVLSEQQSSKRDVNSTHMQWYVYDGVMPVDEETKKAVATAAEALNDAGIISSEGRPPHIDRGHELWLRLFSRASVVQLREVYSGREKEAGSFVSWRLATADNLPAPTLDQYISNWMERDRLRAEFLEWMETAPILVCPVGACAAYAHDTLKVNIADASFSTFRAFSYCQTFNVFDLPVVTLPAGVSEEGLPIGVQIVGRPFAEDEVLAAAAIVEEAIGGWRKPDLILDAQ